MFDALRNTGRSRTVDNAHGIGEDNIHIRIIPGLPIDQTVVGTPAVEIKSGTEKALCANTGKRRAYGINLPEGHRIHKNQPRLAVINHRRQGVLGHHHIERHDNAARLDGSPQQLVHGNGIKHEEANLIAFFQAEAEQGICHEIGAVMEFFPGQPFPAAYDRGLIAE